jgi:hypothetical protein
VSSLLKYNGHKIWIFFNPLLKLSPDSISAALCEWIVWIVDESIFFLNKSDYGLLFWKLACHNQFLMNPEKLLTDSKPDYGWVSFYYYEKVIKN